MQLNIPLQLDNDGNIVTFDIEVYPNYFLIAFKSLNKNTCRFVELRENPSNFYIDVQSQQYKFITGYQPKYLDSEQKQLIGDIFTKLWCFGFNSTHYDLPIIMYVYISNATTLDIYNLSKHIIQYGNSKQYNIKHIPTFNHFDIKELCIYQKSLKEFGSNLHCKTIQELPYDPTKILTNKRMDNIKQYCLNDLDINVMLYNYVKPQLITRVNMQPDFNVDVLSRSDARITEAYFRQRFSNNMTGIEPAQTWTYKAPDYVKFLSDELNEVLQIVQQQYSFDNTTKSKIIPSNKAIDKLNVSINNKTYTVALGGLHSVEKNQVVIPKHNQLLIDKDVTSYYPSLMINNNIYPCKIGPAFIDEYNKILKQRKQIKGSKDPQLISQSATLKIILNGTYGKLNEKYSILYDPEKTTYVTLTGQLCLLMLIEQLELNNISVVSANTDGIVSLLDKSQLDTFNTICDKWQQQTSLNLEDTYYDALYSRDVNNYFAWSGDKIKLKGAFDYNTRLNKNPRGAIIPLSVVRYFKDGISVQDTINNCNDITKFVSTIKSKDGAVFKDNKVGKCIRWYYCKDTNTQIYKTNGNKLPNAKGVNLAMTLPHAIPDDLAHWYYINEALEIVNEFKQKLF